MRLIDADELLKEIDETAIEVENARSGETRPIFKDNKGKRKYYPSNKDMARAYKGALSDEFQCANYECKACGWISETYAP